MCPNLQSSHFHQGFCIPKSIAYRDWNPSTEQQSMWAVILIYRADTWKSVENCKMDAYGIVCLEVEFILFSSLVVNLMQMQNFYLFLSKIYTKGL